MTAGRKIIKKGNGITDPGSGIHLVLSEFTVKPGSQTTFEGSHAVPDSSIEKPNCHCSPSRTHRVELSRSAENPPGHEVAHVKLANRYNEAVSHWSQ
jgi:hypothetical protein